MPNVCLAYKPYVGIRTKFLSMLKNNFCLAVCQRMPAYATVLETYTTQARSQGGGGSGGSYDPPQLPIPKILFHPLAILFHPLAILFHLSAILFHPLAILFHPSAILSHPLAILFHPLAILFHPWNMWMTSHGQCPRGGVLVNVQEWGRFSNWWRHADNVQGGGCAWCSTHPSSDPPPPGWLAMGLQPMPNVPLACVSVYQRMSDIFHTLAYASTIRYSVTGP